MKIPAITFALVVALILACGAVYFTGCVQGPKARRFSCAQTGTAQYLDDDGNMKTALLFACEE